MSSFRTLLRVTTLTKDHVEFIVHGWHGWETPVRLPLTNIPEEIRSLLHEGKRLHAKVNTGAELAEQLVFEEWETT